LLLGRNSAYAKSATVRRDLAVGDWFLRDVFGGLLGDVLATCTTLPLAINKLFGMLAAVVFRDEAIPAYRKKVLENGRQVFRRNFAPLRSVAVGPQERRLTVMPVDFMERLLAISAGLALIPIIDQVPDEAVFGIGFDLRQAFLPAILAFRPARAFIETNVVLAEHRFAGGVDDIDAHGGVVRSLGAGDDALAAVAKIRAQGLGDPEGYRAD